jgi:ribosomal protein S5
VAFHLIGEILIGFVVVVGDGDPGPGLGEGQGNALPYARASACNQSGLSAQ